MRGYTITDIGKVRSENQDSVRFLQNTLPSYGILALCDGMGGASAGSVASEVALSAFTDKVSQLLNEKKKRSSLSDIAREAVEFSNNQVYEQSVSQEKYAGMGTTLVAAIVKGAQCCIVNVGDSRAYLIADGIITQISSDHSLVEDMVKRGSITREQAKNHPKRNVITRALGVEGTIECDIFTPSLKKNNLLLLCSDGLSNTIADEEILEIINRNKNLPDIAKELLDLALTRGAPDNVTVGLLQK